MSRLRSFVPCLDTSLPEGRINLRKYITSLSLDFGSRPVSACRADTGSVRTLRNPQFVSLMDLVPQRNVTAIRQVRAGQSDFVPHLGIEEVRRLGDAARERARPGKGERDELLIQTIFDGCFRVSEVTDLSPNRFVRLAMDRSPGSSERWQIPLLP